MTEKLLHRFEVGGRDIPIHWISTWLYQGEESPVNHDPVNHPAHYTQGGIEVIDAIRAWRLDLDFCRANAIKYIVRAGKKDPEKFCEDLEKAIWYLQQKLKWERSEQAQIAAPQDPPLGGFDWITAFTTDDCGEQRQ